MPAAEIISLDVDEEDKAESSHTSSQKREVDLNIIKRADSEIYKKFFTLVTESKFEKRGRSGSILV